MCAGFALAAVVLSMVPLAWPVLLPGFLVGHDAAAHQTYSLLFTRALGQGQVPVRWVEGVAHGLGQPLFNHYQVGFYYLVALLDALGPDLATALKLAVVVAWASGGMFMFLLCRPLGSLPAALAAAVFVWSPYLLVDVYVRSAFPELLAIGLTPGVLWAADGVLRTARPFFVCALALSSASLLMTHLPTALLMAPVAIAFAAGSSVARRHPPSRVGLVAAAGILGAGLSAFYVLPAVGQLDAIQISRVTTGSFDFHRHFVRPEWWFDRSWGYGGSGEGARDQMSLQLGRVQWFVLAAAVLVLAVPGLRLRLPNHPMTVAGWLLIVGSALFMMTAPSAVVWDAFGPLIFVQFPWRLLMLPAIACAALSAILLSCIRHRTIQAALVLCVVIVLWNDTKPYSDAASSRERATVAIDDPAWPATAAVTTKVFREAAYDPVSVRRTPAPAAGRWAVEGSAEVTVLTVRDARLDLAITAPEAVTLVIHSPFFPGWRASIDDRETVPVVDATSGYMRVTVPAGSHRVSASFERDRLRTIAEAITLVCLATLLAIVGRRRSTAEPIQRHRPPMFDDGQRR